MFVVCEVGDLAALDLAGGHQLTNDRQILTLGQLTSGVELTLLMVTEPPLVSLSTRPS